MAKETVVLYNSPINGDKTKYQRIIRRSELNEKDLKGFGVYEWNDSYTLYRSKKGDAGIIVLELK